MPAKPHRECREIQRAEPLGGNLRFGWRGVDDWREEIHISVRDRGVGISEEDLPHVFEPFYRSRRPAVSKIHGSGLGLCIAKGCAEACGGTLSIVSEESVGCVFTLHLPLHRELPAELAKQDVDGGGE